ncbi:MAG: hypothetical protein ABI388_06060 [Bacteroidia bacterium]
MKILHTVFFILLLSSSSFVFSQNHTPNEATGLPNDLDSKYTPDKNSLLNASSDVYNPGSNNPDATTIKNVVTFDIVNLGRSQATFYYERALHKMLSAQVGIGTTFAKDQIQQTFIPVGITLFANNNNLNYNNNGNSSLSLTDILKNSANNKLGIFLAASLKIYVAGKAPKGVFFQVGTTYAVSNLQLTDNNSSGYSVINSNGTVYTTSSPANIIVKNLNFNFNWGYQFIVGVGKVKFVNTVYAGIGLKKITYTNVGEGNSIYNNNTGNYSYSYIIDGSQRTIIVPSMIFGFSIGLGW